MSKGNIIESNDITEDMRRSSPYLPYFNGPVFTPRINQGSPRILDDDDEDNVIQPGIVSDIEGYVAGPPGGGNLIRGPPGFGSQAAGSPGSGSQAAGPPGSQRDSNPAVPESVGNVDEIIYLYIHNISCKT
jgi:hypothetical protein